MKLWLLRRINDLFHLALTPLERMHGRVIDAEWNEYEKRLNG